MPKLTPQAIFKTAQNPSAWFLSGERLRNAAEIILKNEQAQEVPYFRAHEEAVQYAQAIAYSGTNQDGVAEIECQPPNYPPAQLLYAYAIENVLKGLIVANNPNVVNENRLSRQLLLSETRDLNLPYRLARLPENSPSLTCSTIHQESQIHGAS